MKVFYNIKTKQIYGIEDGYGEPRVLIKPGNVAKEDVSCFELSREFEQANPDIISDITMKKVKDVDKREFEDDPDKKKPVSGAACKLPTEKTKTNIDKYIEQKIEEYLSKRAV